MADTPKIVNIEVTLDPALAMIWRIQTEFVTKLIGEHPADMSDEAKSTFIREQTLALIVELSEMLNAVNWKSWASTSGIHNHEEYRSELCADVFRFFINLCLVGGITAGDVIKSFMDKVEVLNARIGNYDGRTGKCPACHRDYNDKGVTCTASAPGTYNWCMVYGDVDSQGNPPPATELHPERVRAIEVKDGQAVAVHEVGDVMGRVRRARGGRGAHSDDVPPGPFTKAVMDPLKNGWS